MNIVSYLVLCLSYANVIWIYHYFCRDEIGVLEQVSGTSVTALIHHQIQSHVETTCKGNFETAYLESLEVVSSNLEY